MGKLLLSLGPGEPLALLQELPYSDNPRKLDPLLVSALNLSVPNMINGYLLHAVMVDFCWCQLLCDL
jgi:hypothetical protein